MKKILLLTVLMVSGLFASVCKVDIGIHLKKKYGKNIRIESFLNTKERSKFDQQVRVFYRKYGGPCTATLVWKKRYPKGATYIKILLKTKDIKRNSSFIVQ